MRLNPEQQAAADHFEGPCIVTAVPGSGKTRTLTSRVVNLIKKGVSPSNLLCLTFTNKAANEMRDRVAKEIGEISTKVWISTFHRLFVAILRKHGNLVGLDRNFSIYDDKDQKELIGKIARMHEYEDCSRFKIEQMQKVVNDYREDILAFEDHIEGLTSTEVAIIQEYLTLIDEFNAVDFSGILFKSYNLLKDNPSVREELQNRFKFILGDEWQDTNRIQYETISMLAEHGNLFVVADKQQSIFAWRGARPENLDLMKKDFDNVQEHVLPRNYRSTSQITEAAERLIRHNQDAMDVSLISEKGEGEHDVSVREFSLPEDEADDIAAMISGLTATGKSYNDFAILYRTNQLSKLPEMSLRKLDIPYRIYGGFSFFDRMEIKNSLAYLKLIANPSDTISFARAIATPKRKIGPTMVGRLERLCQNKKITIVEACQQADNLSGLSQVARKNLHEFTSSVLKYQKMEQSGASIHDIAFGLFKDTGFYDYMLESSKQDQDWQKRVDNVDELLSSISDFATARPKARMSDYVQSVELMTSDTSQEAEEAVTLLTMHSAKGLEFPVVFVIGIEEGVVPHKQAVAERGDEEERRLFYVAMTRAEEQLHLSLCRYRKKFNYKTKQSHHIKQSPSPFLHEIGVDLSI